MRSKYVCCLTLLSLCLASALHAEGYEVPWTRLRDAAQRYLDTCVDAKEVKSMEKKLRQRVEQRMQDSETLGEDSIMRSLMLDWAFANDARIKRKERDAVQQACYYFVIFHDKGYAIPSQISDQLDEEAVKEINEYLESQINGAAESSKSSEKPEKGGKRDKDKKK